MPRRGRGRGRPKQTVGKQSLPVFNDDDLEIIPAEVMNNLNKDKVLEKTASSSKAPTPSFPAPPTEGFNIFSSALNNFIQRRNNIIQDYRAEALKQPDDDYDSSETQQRKKMKRESMKIEEELTVDDDSDVSEANRSPTPPPEVRPLRARRNKKTTTVLKKLSSVTAAAARQVELDDLEDVTDDEPVVALTAHREISVKFRYRSDIFRIRMKIYQPFASILPELVTKTGAPQGQMLLCLQDAVISSQDTPHSMGLTVADIVECGVLALSAEVSEKKSTREPAMPVVSTDPNILQLQIQSNDVRQRLTLGIHKKAPFLSLKEEYAKERGVSVGQVNLKFDGDTIDDDSTPDGLGLEGGECIDALVHSAS